MTLLFCDGFDAVLGNTTDFAYKWSDRQNVNSGHGSNTFGVTTGRFGGQAFLASVGGTDGFGGQYSAYIGGSLNTDWTTLFFGFALNVQNNNYNSVPLFWAMDSIGGTEIDFRITSGLVPYITRAGTSILTAPRAITLATWTYVEIAVNVSATAGWCELYLDGLAAGTYYGTGSNRATAAGNTMGGSSAGIRQFRIGGSLNGGNLPAATYWFDDVYVCNNAGPNNNDHMGDIHVATLLPTGASADGTGAHTQFTLGGTTPAATNWQSVNEATPNADVSYVSDNVVGHTDTYDYPSLPTVAASIKAVVGQYITRRDDAGMRQIQAVVRQSGADSYSPGTYNTTASYLAAGLVMEVNPGTGLAWTPSDVNNAEFGYRIYS